MMRLPFLRFRGLFGGRRSPTTAQPLAAHLVRSAAERRAELQAQLSGMNKHDSRRGEVERDLRRQTLTVLSGGRA
jgi:hypothetical protein